MFRVGSKLPGSVTLSRSHVVFICGLLAGLVITHLLPSSNVPPAASRLTQTAQPAPICETNASQFVLRYPSGYGSRRRFPVSEVHSNIKRRSVHNVFDDLAAFTGLKSDELIPRLTRDGRHHFIFEHLIANPQSPTELTFYYRQSLGYLWGNAMHGAKKPETLGLTRDDGPVLDYSGGVGTQAIALAKEGIEVIYFGIGLMEFEFTRFRVKRHGLQDMVKFVEPYAKDDDGGKGWRFEPRTALQRGVNLPESGVGAMLALDVFEHIPQYEVTARYLASLVRTGGKLIENTPFDKGAKSDNEIHLKASVPMEEALAGFEKKALGKTLNVWIKK